MSLVQYEPFSLINQLQQDINNLFSRAETSESSSATAAWVPAADIAEYSDRFELAVDLPGVNLESRSAAIVDRSRRSATRNRCVIGWSV